MLQINPFPGAWRLFAPFQQRQGFHHRLLRWKGVKTGKHHQARARVGSDVGQGGGLPALSREDVQQATLGTIGHNLVVHPTKRLGL